MKYRTKITTEEMLLAKTDDEALLNILQRLESYIRYIVEKMYHVYGAKYDAALSKEDLYEFCRANIIRGIRMYYHPERYDKGRDKHGYYKNGFSYIVNITNKFIKYFWKRQHRKKRIPPECIVSLETPVNDDGDLLLDNLLGKSDTGNTEFLDHVLNYFSQHNRKIGKFHLYDLVYDMLVNNLDYIQLARKYKVKNSEMRKIIKEHIVEQFRRRK